MTGHILVNCDTGILDVHDHIPPDLGYYMDLRTIHKAKIAKISSCLLIAAYASYESRTETSLQQ